MGVKKSEVKRGCELIFHILLCKIEISRFMTCLYNEQNIIIE